jgi:protein-tyrosine phosphatase
MANAELINPRAVEGGTAYTVSTSPFDAAPFSGPDHRDWDAFRLTGDGATFEWRTGADHVRRIAERVARGEWTFARARRDPFVERWLDGDRLADFVDAASDDDPSLADMPDAKLARRTFVEVGPFVENDIGLYGYYAEDDDSCLRDAASALDLPAWAHVQTFLDGGPGSGFENAAIVLEDGKDLRDLAAWLEERVRREPSRPEVDFISWQALRTRGRLGLTHVPGRFRAGRSTDSDERLREDLRVYSSAYRASRVLTLLDRQELANVGRIDLAARRAGLSWSHFPIPDVGVPASLAETSRRVSTIVRDLEAGRTTIVHCRAGLGRSGTIAACVLVAAGTAPDKAIAAVRAARPGAIESPAQAVFVREFAEWRAERKP